MTKTQSMLLAALMLGVPTCAGLAAAVEPESKAAPAAPVSEKVAAIENFTLSDYYYKRIPHSAKISGGQAPWSLLRTYRTNLTDRIDKVHGPAPEFWIDAAWAAASMQAGMMPNKRSNQGILEETAESASVAVGALVEVVSMGTKLPHGDMNPVAYAMKDGTLRALERLDRSVEPYLYKFPSMIVKRDVMLATAREGYSCSTELANVLVREYGLDYRTAHEIIRHFVTESAKKGIPSQAADVDIFQAAAQAVVNKKLEMSEHKLRQVLDPVHFVEVTDSRGGAAPKEVARMIAERKAKLVEARKRNLARIEKLERAREKLLADLRDFCETAQQPKA